MRGGSEIRNASSDWWVGGFGGMRDEFEVFDEWKEWLSG